MTSGDRIVDVRTQPREHVTLREAEDTALRLLHAVPEPAPVPEQTFGFCLSSDTELAPDPEPQHDESEE